ncbi:dUTPase [Bacillus lacus]|uniref:dUTPase n=1 Tax=Metabacillus lacus TaxID=1983721 RepID=A0A7X2IZ28_9BACI|nr:dUTP diphosphatase [Metabacillus lacus]MRX71788.1 dUTPase [Metabacillus lacus]
MNFQHLYEMQQVLDHNIENKHGLQEEDLFERKCLALLVELGELANETRCFKFWSVKSASETSVILEEYVDGIHFILSLGLEIKADRNAGYPTGAASSEQLTHQFLHVYQTAMEFKNTRDESSFHALFSAYLKLGELLGFSKEVITEAYKQKNTINHQRQKQNY